MLNIDDYILKEQKYSNGKTFTQRFFKAYCKECNIDRNVYILKCQYKKAPYCKSCRAKERTARCGNPMQGRSQDCTKFRETYQNVIYTDYQIVKVQGKNKRKYRMSCAVCKSDRGHKFHREANRSCIKCHAKKYTKKTAEHKKIYNSMKANINVRFNARKLNKDLGCFRWLPYTLDDLIKHLEAKFEPWMTWDNHGNYCSSRKTWQIDHIKADAKFHYTSVHDQEFKDSWSLSNLQPLEAMANILKSDN